MSSRLLPLHTCGVSFLTIAHSTCSRAQNLNGRLGSTTRKIVRVTNLVNPLIFVLQYQWLLFLSFIDDRLLAIANIVEKIFPSSKLIFDKIDNLVHLIETFPRKFDDAVDKLPCFNQVVFLEWAVTQAISLLKFTIAILMNWGRDGTREKEILVDMNCDKGRNGSKSADKSECCTEGTISSVAETGAMDEKTKSGSHKEVAKMEAKEDDEKGSYKRAMEEEGTRDQAAMEGEEEEFKHGEKGATKEVEHKENEKSEAKMEEIADESSSSSCKGIISNEENSEVKDEKKEARVMENNRSIENEEDILELFETAWLMKPASVM